jgi:hypothetical protein
MVVSSVIAFVVLLLTCRVQRLRPNTGNWRYYNTVITKAVDNFVDYYGYLPVEPKSSVADLVVEWKEDSATYTALVGQNQSLNPDNKPFIARSNSNEKLVDDILSVDLLFDTNGDGLIATGNPNEPVFKGRMYIRFGIKTAPSPSSTHR